MRPSDSALQSALLDRAWRQWIAIGVDAVAEPDDAVVDPEALIALTAELGDADARLRDVSTDWCVTYGRYVNGSRLKQVAREMGTPPAAIGEFVATVIAAGGPAWPMATQPRSDYLSRGKARLNSTTQPPRLRIRLRAAFGVNARADVLAALLAVPAQGLSVADLTRTTRFTKPNVASAVDALLLSGLVEARRVGNERRLTLAPDIELLPGLKAPAGQPDWATRFGVYLEVVRLQVDGLSPTVRAIETRRVAEGLMPRLLREGLPRPNLDAFGDGFSFAFDRWVVSLVDHLRLDEGTGQELLVTRSDDRAWGASVFAGTRVPVDTLFDYLEASETLREFLEQFPTVTRAEALAVLEGARARAGEEAAPE